MKKSAVILLDDYWHPSETIEPLLPLLFDEKEWHLRVTDDPNYVGALFKAPDLILNFKDGVTNTTIPTRNWYSGGALEGWTTEMLIKGGGAGYIGVHCGLANIPETHPVYTDLLHGRFITHPPMCEVTVHITGEHPITNGVEDFTITDEHYQMQGDWDKTQVLATTRSEHGEQVGLWAHQYGNGRVVGITPGHTTQVLTSPGMLRLLRNAVAWAAKQA